ncbi:MmcQ/YjbR family DNA-binding protein [Brevibacterium sp. K11IcPPYGO002]|uniref:MmcQ/YjbR family DNA-binding protein n=1 Tax=Brevibacterium sp. K11IcPPYGO002 TaxID=3058837 RepID=UPI003D81435D
MAHPQMFDDDDPMLERVRAIALGLPEAAEKISHGRPAFFTKKIFAHYSGTEKHDSGAMVQHPQALLVLLDPMNAEAVLEQPGSFIPMYLGPSGWVGLEIADLDDGEIRELLVDSYRNTASARLIKALDAQE